VVYGNYKSLHQATVAIKKLPSELREFHPWVRKFSTAKKSKITNNKLHKTHY
jgi:septal ring-binding cell division protein DamX